MMYSREQSAELNRSVLAESYSVELLEYLRSQTPKQLKANFSINPIDAKLPPYKLCAHINLLNRTEGVLLNKDPIASLPISLLDGATEKTRANRYYQIQVANVVGDAADDSIKVTTNYCNKTAKDIVFFGEAPAMGQVALAAQERFVLTVGVSWFQKDKKGDNIKQVVVSSLLPEQKEIN